MTAIVARTCTEVRNRADGANGSIQSRELRHYRDVPAFVLLGDPGMGKTTAFQTEAAAEGGSGHFITARDFLTLDLAHHPELACKTLFIDGLDEVRSGSIDPRPALDRIRKRLDRLGNPRFRISCRPSDWLRANDRVHLARVAPDSELTVLSLDPLSEQDSTQILGSIGASDPQNFVQKARVRNIDSLLANPHSLGLLAKAVGVEGSWPSSRVELFERACRQLAAEWNQEHAVASARPAIGQLLDAAGYLSALLLTTGNAGLLLKPSDAFDGFLTLEDCEGKPEELLNAVLKTGVFRATGEGRLEPVHRRVAEFLGGRYLAGLVAGGHPVMRILALMTGFDGGVVSSLRGLSAWFATLCPAARDILILRDPTGVGQYGDLSVFATSEKSKLLASLRGEINNLYSISGGRQAFMPLVSKDMRSHIAELLSESDPDQDDHQLAGFVLGLIPQGPRLAGLDGILISVAADGRWTGYVRAAALRAYVCNCPDSANKTRQLIELLERICRMDVSDPDNDLRGILLSCLYPMEIGSERIWDHLTPGPVAIFGGPYWRFWFDDLVRKSGPSDLLILLDQLHDRADDLLSRAESRGLSELQVRLLSKGLKSCGDEMSAERLHRWLSTGRGSHRSHLIYDDSEAISRIREWLEARPRLQLDVSFECLLAADAGGLSIADFHDFRECMFGVCPPSDFKPWILSNIGRFAESKPRLARRLITTVVSDATMRPREIDKTKSEFLAAVHGHDELVSYVDWVFEQQAARERRKLTRASDRKPLRPADYDRWLRVLRDHVQELRENRAPPTILFDLGRVAFGLPPFRVPAGSAEERIGSCFDGEPALSEAALLAVRNAPFRADVPTVEETLDLSANSKMSMLNYAVLAGLDVIGRISPNKLIELTDDQVRNLTAINLCSSANRGTDPAWYCDWIESRPELVEDVLIRHATAEFRRKSDDVECIRRLAYDHRYASLARRVTLRLLEAFPIRCNLDQVRVLDHLLIAALAHVDQKSLAKLIAKKTSFKSMLPAPRAHWLAAGAVAVPSAYIGQLEAHAHGKYPQAKQLAMFLESRRALPKLLPRIGPDAAYTFAKLIGSQFGPRWEDGWVGPEANAADLIRDLSTHLSTDPSEDATRALGKLSADPDLTAWSALFEYARGKQLVLRRGSQHAIPTVKSVNDSLKLGHPANVADLFALVDDHLCHLVRGIRSSSTNDWRQYWNEPHGADLTPKHEEQCRDALLSDLRKRLPAGIHAEPEGRYAFENRSDIKVSSKDFHIPVEIKRHEHRDLWSAIRDQLISKYASDPDTGGFGIYLVFWFGAERRFQAPPSGARPTTADGLRAQLAAALSDEELRKISVRVVDVSRPNN